MNFLSYSVVFKTSYFIFLIPTILVFISALMSAKHIGGTLGSGLKKVAAGSIIHTALVMTFLALEQGQRGLLSDYWVRMFFLVGGIFGSVLLVIGFSQVYQVAKEFKLFTP